MENWIAMNPNFPDEMPKEGSYFFFTYRETKSNRFADVQCIFYDQHGKRLIGDLLDRINLHKGGVMLWIPYEWPEKPVSLDVRTEGRCTAKGDKDCNQSYCVDGGKRCSYYKDYTFIK